MVLGRETPLDFRTDLDTSASEVYERKDSLPNAGLVAPVAIGDDGDLTAEGSQQISVVATEDLETAAGGV